MMSFPVKCYIISPNNNRRWIVIGKTKEYLVTEFSCTCRDYLSKIMKKEGAKCKHMIQYLQALESNQYDTYNISAQEFRDLRPYILELKK